MASGEVAKIESISVGDVVLSFNPSDDSGQDGLVPRRVTRLYRNTTNKWVKLSFIGGHREPLITTPGHHFLDESGNFPTIAEMLEREGGRTKIVLEDGSLAEVQGSQIAYSAETADLFEQAHSVAMPVTAGNLALKPEPVEGWQTYNFEVEDLHTYVAGGVRVHNISEQWAHEGYGLTDNSSGTGLVAITRTGRQIAVNQSVVDRITAEVRGRSWGGGISLAGRLEIAGFGVAAAGGTNADIRQVMVEELIDGGVDPNSSTGKAILNESYNDVQEGKKQQQTTGVWSSTNINSNSNSDPVSNFVGGVFEAASNVVEAVVSVVASVISSFVSAISSIFGGSDSNSSGGSFWSWPLVVDLNLDGAIGLNQRSSSYTDFDFDDDGYDEATAWVSPEDGYIVVDLAEDGSQGPDGLITQSSELAIANLTAEEDTDLEALGTVFDSNGDGVVNASDARFDELKVWQDINGNGEADAGELTALSANGITSIDLASYGDPIDFEDGSRINGLFDISLSNGGTMLGADVTLVHDIHGIRMVETTDGFRVEVESGESAEYRILESGQTGNIDLTAEGLHGAFGREGDDTFDATGTTHEVVMSGGAGDDTLIEGGL